MAQKKEPPGRARAEEAALLQRELARACRELEGLRGHRAQLRAQQESLEQEAQRLRAESLEFLGYLAKRAQRRLEAAVSLAQENQRVLREIQQQRQQALAHFEAQEAALRGQLLQKEAELGRLRSGLEGLRGVRALRQEQAGRVRELQRELVASRQQQALRVQEAQARFLREKVAYEEEARQRAGGLAQQAQEAAARCLQQHSQAVHRQNRELRQELQQLLQRARELQAHKKRLQGRAQSLRQEHQYLQGLALLRHAGRGQAAQLRSLRAGGLAGRPSPAAQ